LFLVLSSAFSPLSSNHAISTLRDSISQADNLSESGFTGFEDFRIPEFPKTGIASIFRNKRIFAKYLLKCFSSIYVLARNRYSYD
jgi:hypothetical protein